MRVIRRRIPIRPTICIFICSTLLFLYYLLSSDSSNERKVLDIEVIRKLAHRVYSVKDDSMLGKDVCILPHLDPWDPEIEKRFPDLGSFPKQCTSTISQMTSLANGLLTTNWEPGLISWLNSPSCYYRCLNPIDDYNMMVEEWTFIDNEKGAKPGCDIVEVQCRRWFWFNYRFMHTQVTEKTAPTTNQLDTNGTLSDYNFYWILIDSTSSSMFKRSMRQTRDVLMDEMKAIEFPYLNKIPVNSRPNAYAMFFGEQAFRINANPFNDQEESGRDIEEICRTELETLHFVGFDFQKAGYRSLFTEDWALGVVNWPDCVGFKKPMGDHFLRPFWLRLDGFELDIDRMMRFQMYTQSCKLGHNYDLQHLLQFVDKYQGQPKFSIDWVTQLAHDDNSVLFGVDNEFADFFEELNDKSKNSFIFFQGDHGIRSGPVRDIPIIGEIEDNNPFLYVIVPEKLRENPSLMNQLNENAKHLISPFDMYASAVDIAHSAHKWDLNTRFDEPSEPIKDREFIGSSIFHKMKQPRTCSNLRIPWDFCICYMETIDLIDPKLSKRVAQSIVDSINKQLDESKYSDKCLRHVLSPDYPIRLEEFLQEDSKSRMLKAKFETMPGRALYQGIVQFNNNDTITLMQTEFSRLNQYVDQAHCIPQNFFKNYCVCHDQVQ